jgi:hypothetical protein
MMIARRFFLSALALCAYLLCADAHAQLFRPHEPLDPSKAQSLPFTPMSITTTKGTFNFQVEVADTDQKRSTGLMHRSELAADKGMLFDMKRTGIVSFWMRNTFIPLDMIFIAPDGTVRSIAENTVPHNEAGVSSYVAVYAVLELKAGAAKQYGIQVGDKITHAIFKK